MLLRQEKEKTLFTYKVIYIIVHYLYSFFEYIYDAWFKVKRTVISYCHGTPCSADNLTYVYSEARKLGKIPNHLTILLGHESHSVQDLSNIILWSLAAGVPFISFYDSNGDLKQNENNLRVAVEKKLQGNHNVIWHDSVHSHKNGIVGKKIHAKIYAQEDGRNSVVKLVKQFPLSANIQDIDIEHVDSCLRKDYEFPDPDLAIYCGKVFSLFGCPPWQIRITEFLNVRSHHNVNVYNFIDLLKKYSKCEQRLGK